MLDLGDILSTTFEVRNSSNVLTTPATHTCTITLPDGSTTTPTLTVASVGVLRLDYPTVQAGRHEVRVVTTTPDSRHTTTFDVDEQQPTGIVSLADTRAFLNVTATTNDEELRDVIDEATEIVEGWVGPVVRRTVTALGVFPSGGMLFLEPPVISLSSITSAYGYTTTYTITDYTLDADSGIVRANSGKSTFVYPVDVTYVAGRAVVKGVIRRAAKVLIRGLWAEQRVAGVTPGMRAEDDAEAPFSPFLLARAEAQRMLEDAGLMRPAAVA